MCGILASITKRPLPERLLDKALGSLHHRGPDGFASWLSDDGLWTLGHTRLSIIGLDNGEQPISSADGTVHIVVNGEFYGYDDVREQLKTKGCHFATDSDSEIALHLYQQIGVQLTTELRGEFALIIADQRENMMIAIRDRFGIKPLYYASIKGEIFFASEIKTLLAMGVPAHWDFEGVMGGITRPNDRTEFAGIYAVPPGCYAIAKDGEIRIQTYWDWNFPSAETLARDTRTEHEVVEEFRQVLVDSVKQRMVADVEVASYLSGGIDSCAVLGLAQSGMDQPIRAFTLTFDNSLYDEAAIAQKQAEFVGASYHPIPITGVDLADAWTDAVWHAETPMFNGNGVAKYLLSRAVHDAGIKVVFTGEGADEMLGGYPFYRVDAVQNNPALSSQQKEDYISQIFGANEASRAIMLPDEINGPDMEAVRSRLGWAPAVVNTAMAIPRSLSPFFTSDFAAQVRGHIPIVESLDRMDIASRLSGRDPLNQSLYIGAKTFLPNFILTYLGDRMEMAHSIEGRVPFLDHKLAEVAARVPVDMKVKGIREKHVLREAAKEVLIPEVYNRQKHAFNTPPTRDKNDPMLAFYRDTFASQSASDQPLYDMKKVNAALDTLLDCPEDQRIAIEGGFQRIASVVIMQEKFAMS